MFTNAMKNDVLGQFGLRNHIGQNEVIKRYIIVSDILHIPRFYRVRHHTLSKIELCLKLKNSHFNESLLYTISIAVQQPSLNQKIP